MMPEPFTHRRRLGAIILFISLLPLLLQFSSLVKAQSTGTLTLSVHVTGVRNSKGQIRAFLFQNAKGFPSDASQSIQRQSADIDSQALTAQIVFTGLQEGIYAVILFHDENMNHKLDKNVVGIPKEGYAASNNPRKKMGPPDFEEAKFQLKGQGQSLEIKLMY
jgi:uncharacterized protein (DUF2141 family)